ncbi:MAG: DUF488 family protein [Phycisphaerae bacterium]|nr:DUF488 family protein [Phycisphaerae bacterium]
MISVKRVYDPPKRDDGCRLLVDRLWPRGVKKNEARLDGWIKEAAPSDELRQWFGHEAAKWEEFRRRYFEELNHKPEAWRPITDALKREKKVTLLFGAKDSLHNNAVALKEYLTSARRDT